MDVPWGPSGGWEIEVLGEGCHVARSIAREELRGCLGKGRGDGGEPRKKMR